MNHDSLRSGMHIPAILLLCIACLTMPGFAQRPQPKPHPTGPWSNTSLSPDERADLVMKEMTVDEKIALLHGVGMPTDEPVTPENAASNRGVGYAVGVPRLGIPGIDMSDAAYGVRSSGVNGRYSTALPANVAAAASWDTDAAYEYGALIGRELRAQGFNMTLGGGVNLTRDPRNGRTFEYLGEDPVLAGTLVARLIEGTQSANVIGDIKHYALNDQESGRNSVNITISKRAMRESDLLAFEIGVEQGKPAAVMCSYNRVNGDFACENQYLLKEVLEKDWKFPGFVVSDWGGTHSDVKASAAGLDNEQPGRFFYEKRFKDALDAGKIPQAELDEHVHRILRSMFAAGVVDHPRQRSVIDPFAGFETSRKIEEGGIVLLKNEKAQLPLSAARLKTIAVIGSHSDVGMISGGGSAQVDPIGGNAIKPPGQGATRWMEETWFPTSPLKAIQARAPHATVKYDPGTDPAAAAAAAKGADVAIVFVGTNLKVEAEDRDRRDMNIPGAQQKLIEAVFAANQKTVVVLMNAGPLSTKWARDNMPAMLEAWYAGEEGGNAVADVLLGDFNPAGRLPYTVYESAKDVPPNDDYDITHGYTYMYFKGESVFPFGHGLSYTSFEYGPLTLSTDKIAANGTITLSVDVTNTGKRAGDEVVQFYGHEEKCSVVQPIQKLVAFARVHLQPGEKKTVTQEMPASRMQIYDETQHKFAVEPGTFDVMVGSSSKDIRSKSHYEVTP
jgi:beta-glucosidase